MVITGIIPNTKRIRIKMMMKHFNEEAKRINSPYYIYSDCLYLSKRGFFNNFRDIDIFYSETENYFYFPYKIPYSVLKDIKPILDKIPERFEVKLE